MTNDEVQAMVEKLNAEDCNRGRYDRQAAAMLTALSAEVEKQKGLVRRVQSAAKALDTARCEVYDHYVKASKINTEAVETLDSERDMNAILTEENDRLRTEVEALKAEARSKALDYLALDGQAMELEKFKTDTMAEIAILKASCMGYQMDIEELQAERDEARADLVEALGVLKDIERLDGQLVSDTNAACYAVDAARTFLAKHT